MITVAYITARKRFCPDWFFDSLSKQSGLGDVKEIIIVDRYAEAYDSWTPQDVESRRKEIFDCAAKAHPVFYHSLKWVAPKPNVWSGKHRLTPVDWWSTSSYRNTALCYCSQPFIAYLDDRCVLMPTWLDGVRQAQQEQYVVCGTYEKRVNIGYRDGVMVAEGMTSDEICKSGDSIGQDSRGLVAQGKRMICPGSWVFGCTFALPTEWMLNVNGVDESWDSVSMEDTHFGQMLENNLYPIYHDPRMKMIEDRSGSTEHQMKRSSKERHPHDKEDKTHKLIEKLWNNKRSAHQWDFRKIREHLKNGGSFPIPTEPTVDWFDNQQLKEMW